MLAPNATTDATNQTISTVVSRWTPNTHTTYAVHTSYSSSMPYTMPDSSVRRTRCSWSCRNSTFRNMRRWDTASLHSLWKKMAARSCSGSYSAPFSLEPMAKALDARPVITICRRLMPNTSRPTSPGTKATLNHRSSPTLSRPCASKNASQPAMSVALPSRPYTSSLSEKTGRDQLEANRLALQLEPSAMSCSPSNPQQPPSTCARSSALSATGTLSDCPYS
mmetsp:Transcript_13553/g.43311  ORF Transcript_13553/g.43311 Transcript_13553/m.43311 type:complete len:222 (+) Transcript_13553:313-978(+)